MADRHRSGPLLALAGRRIGVTAERRWREQADLLERRGAEVLRGPTMRTIDLSASDDLRRATQAVIEDAPDVLVASTGMGMRMWLEAASAWGVRASLLAALGGTRVLARGAKAASAVRAAGLDVAWQAPAETMTEVVDHLLGPEGCPDRTSPKAVGSALPSGQSDGGNRQSRAGKEPGSGHLRVAFQLFEPRAHFATDRLRASVGELITLPVYVWDLPVSPEPALHLAREIVAGRLDAVTFTSQPAVRQLFELVETAPRPGSGSAEADIWPTPHRLRDAFSTSTLAVCVGEVCAAAATEMGIDRVIWPDPPRLVAMVKRLTEELNESDRLGP
ncbi:MAG: uroporphyrinogen-III synthase [Acidimicrobiales bacterium]